MGPPLYIKKHRKSEAEGTRMARERPRGVIADARFGGSKPPKTLCAMTRQLAPGPRAAVRSLMRNFATIDSNAVQNRRMARHGSMKRGTIASLFPDDVAAPTHSDRQVCDGVRFLATPQESASGRFSG